MNVFWMVCFIDERKCEMLLSYISTAANLTGVVPLNKCYSGARSSRARAA